MRDLIIAAEAKKTMTSRDHKDLQGKLSRSNTVQRIQQSASPIPQPVSAPSTPSANPSQIGRMFGFNF